MQLTMKLNKWLFGAAALAMMASCSDNLTDGPQDPSGGKPQITEGEGYIGISLQLPEQPSTRAGNDIYDDGLPAEYNVNRAALLLFWGDEDDEANAEFLGAYPIGSDERFEQPNGDNITTSFQDVATLNKKIDKKEDDGKQLWGMAIVNYDKKIFKIEEKSSSPNYGSLTVKAKTIDPATETLSETATDVTITVRHEPTYEADGTTVKTPEVKGMTFSDFRKLVTNQPLYTSNGYGTQGGGFEIFMTNAPLSDSPGEGSNPDGGDASYNIQTLAKLDATKISTVIETARVNPAGCIFVERAVSKITLSSFPLRSTLKYQKLTQSDDGTIVADGEPTDVNLSIIKLGWLLDNEEKDSYLVRFAQKSTTDNFWTLLNKSKYRFVGSSKMNTPENSTDEISANHNWYRTYWCKDPNYLKSREFNEQATISSTYSSLLNNNTLDTDAVLYSRENTFSVANQNYRNTTRVVFKVQYKWTETVDGEEKDLKVYCRAGDPSIIYKKNDAQMFIMSPFISSNTIHDFVLANVDVDKAKANGIVTETTIGGNVTYNIKYGISDFKPQYGTVSTLSDGKLLQMTSVELDENGKLAKSLKDGVTTTTIATALKSAMDVANGKVKIRSFEDETNGNNICYYATNIQHFGDTYCPMPKDAEGKLLNKGITTEVVYEENNPSKYLGRWGMVRNNWYDLRIDVIKNMGYADVPDGDVDTSDDNEQEEYYLSAKVHVLSWAKRTQNVEF